MARFPFILAGLLTSVDPLASLPTWIGAVWPTFFGALRGRWYSNFFLNRNGPFEDKQGACRDQRANDNGEQVQGQVADHIGDGQDEDPPVRYAQLTPKEHRQPPRHGRARDTGRDHAERIFGSIGNGPFGNKGQP